MVSSDSMNRFCQTWPWWRWGLTGLSVLALVLSSYLSWHYLIGMSMMGCGSGSSCEKVLSSGWSTIGGVLPVSGLAAGVYLAMLVASLSIGPGTTAPVRRLAWGAMLVLVGSAAGSAVWFTILQKWVIGAFCSYCTTTHIIGLLLAALVIWRAPLQSEKDSSLAAPRRVIPLFAIGLALAGLMAACQVVFTPPAVYRDGQSQGNLPALDPHTVPLIGSPDALYIVTLLFDYQCTHCQQIHFMLNEAIRRYDGKLAFMLCPAPLNSRCNSYVAQDAEEYKDSCELVKVGLAFWVANRQAFPAFENWMFSFEAGDRWRPRTLDAAKAKAIELVSQAKFDAALADPWIDQYLQTSVRIYGATIQSGNNAVPKLVFGSRWVIPQPYDAAGLVSILQDSLALPTP